MNTYANDSAQSTPTAKNTRRTIAGFRFSEKGYSHPAVAAILDTIVNTERNSQFHEEHMRNDAARFVEHVTRVDELPSGFVTPEDVAGHKLRLLPMKGITAMLQEALAAPNVQEKEVARLISSDVMLTLSLMRLVSSPLYRGNAASPSSVEDAVRLVGLRQVASLVMGAVQLHSIYSEDKEFPLEAFWLHSVSTAIVARQIAQRSGRKSPDTYYTAALLHDMGRLFLSQKLGSSLKSVYLMAVRNGIPLPAAEKRYLGFTHADVGEAVAKKWSLSAEITHAVANHHSPEIVSDSTKQGKEQTKQSPDDVAAITHIANFIAKALGYHYWADPSLPEISIQAWDTLDIALHDLPSLIADCRMEIEAVSLIAHRPQHTIKNYNAHKTRSIKGVNNKAA